MDYTHFDTLLAYLRETRPAFLINAAGYTGKPNVDACETARADTLQGNTLFPQTVAHACSVAGIPWGHVSSGCIYSGAHFVRNGVAAVQADLMRPEIHAVWERDRELIHGFTEQDEPNFSFRRPPCSFYSGTKAMGEETIAGIGRSFIWRLRIPFDEHDNARNYLSKLQRYSKLLDCANSISHRGDFVSACLDLWERRVPFGTYNVTNSGWITTRDVVETIRQFLPSDRDFQFFVNDAEFYSTAAQTPRSNCVMDVTKLLAAGVRIRPVQEALEHALRHWRPEPESAPIP
nr:H204 [uncultured bacterium]